MAEAKLKCRETSAKLSHYLIRRPHGAFPAAQCREHSGTVDVRSPQERTLVREAIDVTSSCP